MGKGSRHGRNQNCSAVFSYHEREKYKKQSGYGSIEQRLTCDTVKEFDACSLTLQTCREPMTTLDGHLFDKEAILEYIVNRKKDMKRLMMLYEQQEQEDEVEKEMAEQRERENNVKKFFETESTPVRIGGTFNTYEKEIVTANQASKTSRTYEQMHKPTSVTANEKKQVEQIGQKREHNSFWTADKIVIKKKRIEKPDLIVRCPVTKKPLKFKDLIPVKFTPLPEAERVEIATVTTSKLLYMCPVTNDALTQTTPLAVLKPTGDVVTVDCVEKIIKKDWVHPLTGQKLKESDIIYLKRGGTGFAATNPHLEGKLRRVNMALS